MPETPGDRMIREVGEKQERMIRARGRRDGVWSSIALFGSVGWSVAIPTIVGVAIGVWIDTRWHSRFSWAVMLLIAGLIVGCVNAWKQITGGRK